MLMRFSISNFLSFPYCLNDDGVVEPVEFTMYAGRTEHFKERVIRFKERKVLKFASIYGANAAGKSNLVTAMEYGKNILMSGMEHSLIKTKYCRNNEKNRDEPTLFEYEFTIENRCFAYGFTVNLWKRKVLSEWLTELDNMHETTIFERDVEQHEYFYESKYFSNSKNEEQFNFFINDANRIESTLLLFELNRRKLKEDDFLLYNSIFDWFRNNLLLIYPDTRIGKSYLRFGNDKEKLVQILECFDTGITGYQMQEINENAFREYFSKPELADMFLQGFDKGRSLKGRSILKYNDVLFELEFHHGKAVKISKLLFRHGNNQALFEYGEESDGTQRLIELVEIILNDDEEKTFVIDELDRSLHPQMTRKFVEIFFRFSKEKRTQMMITTHESNLMDLSLLRRDEIWFAERNNAHSSILYPLEMFKTRYDKVVSKAYLSGRYGAIPVFQDFEYVWGGGKDEEAESEDS